MALYDLARGGIAHGYPAGNCKHDEETGLPAYLQPETRDGYQFRDKVTWKSLLHELDRKYDKDVTDLQEGDRIRIFLQPNHANLKSYFVDFRNPTKGFKFTFNSVNGADYETGKIYKNVYNDCGKIETSERLDESETITENENTQYVNILENGYNGKVEALEIEIVAMPVDKALLEQVDIQFGRRYEVEGYMMPSTY